MKHPLSSKERRGLVAVAAAALLCISSAFIFRSCSDRITANQESANATAYQDKDAGKSASSDKQEKPSKVDKPDKSNRPNKPDKTKTKSKKTKAEKQKKSYPVRDPLSQPCD